MPYRINLDLVMIFSRKYYLDGAVWMMGVIADGMITYKMLHPRGTRGDFRLMARFVSMPFAIIVLSGPVDERIFASATI